MSSHLRRIFAHDYCPPFLHQFFFFYWVILTSTQACFSSVCLKKKETNPVCIGFSSSDCPIYWIFLVGKFLNIIFIRADSVLFFFFQLKYSWHIVLCSLQVFYIGIWHLHSLWNDHHKKSSNHLFLNKITTL